MCLLLYPQLTLGQIADDHAEKMKAGTALFKEQIRGVLKAQCLDCHGGKSVKADFDLSTREKLLDSGALDEDAESSYLFQLITHEEEPFMPHKRDKLPPETIAAIGKWIELGAPYDRPLVEVNEAKEEGASAADEVDRSFWSFQPLGVVAPPNVGEDPWIRTAIDQFIVAKHRERGLHPNPVADRRTLIRRAYFDLLGLPPTPEEVESFFNDPDPQAYDRLLDRLLESPHYGERWARHWMDVARFAESHGYEQDYDRPHAYHYRDFLIRAFNADMPYDQFVSWQLAGDEIAPEEPLAMMATGFLGAGAFPTQLTEREFESARYDELDDMASTTGTAFLGLTVGCARCHDHKYDPISTRDYYRLAANFTTAIRSEIDLELGPEGEPTKVQVTSEGFPPTKHHADDRGFPHFYPETHVLARGDVEQKQEVADPAFLPVLYRNDTEPSSWRETPPENWTRTSFRRASLANWMTDPRHGAGNLTARVIVNRLWYHHFGRGIVATPSDFGMQGERPTHPELLDWLATDLIHHGWRLKRLHKLIMTSSVYMQSSAHDAEHAALDRENTYYWKRDVRRLEAEAIRDALLKVSGLLDPTMHGQGTLDQSMQRRSVYFFIKRSKLIPMMMLFDWPEHLVGIGRRSSTTIAPQALLFLNNPQARQYATGFAERLGDGDTEDSDWVTRAYEIALGRPATAEEIRRAEAFLASQTKSYASAGHEAPHDLALTDFCQALMSSNEFVYVD